MEITLTETRYYKRPVNPQPYDGIKMLNPSSLMTAFVKAHYGLLDPLRPDLYRQWCADMLDIYLADHTHVGSIIDERTRHQAKEMFKQDHEKIREFKAWCVQESDQEQCYRLKAITRHRPKCEYKNIDVDVFLDPRSQAM